MIDDFPNRESSVRPVLERLGQLVAKEVPGAEWHLEFPRSNVFDFSGLLIFHMPGVMEDAAVLEISLRGSTPAWTIDAIGFEGVYLDEERHLPESLNRAMTEDASAAAWALGVVGERMTTVIARHLSSPSAGVVSIQGEPRGTPHQ